MNAGVMTATDVVRMILRLASSFDIDAQRTLFRVATQIMTIAGGVTTPNSAKVSL